jgi:polysaccharide biosynthesis/export protein
MRVASKSVLKMNATLPTPIRGGTGLDHSRVRLGRALMVMLLAGLGAGGMTGCEVDSFIDPSVTGRWEHTPTRVPILERLASIEEPESSFVERTEISREDLVPSPASYRIGPGDQIDLELHDLVRRGERELYQRIVDARGMIDIPQLGEIFLSGRTIEQAKATIEEAMRKFIGDPLVGLSVSGQRQQLYHIIGAVERPGSYIVPGPEYRLLEAVTSAGRFTQLGVDEIYIIRQTSLQEAVPPPRNEPGTQQTPGKAPIDLIEDLSKPQGGEPSRGSMRGGVSPSAFARGSGPNDPPPIDLVDSKTPANRVPATGNPTGNQLAAQPGSSSAPSAEAPVGLRKDTSWVFLNGKWIEVVGAAPSVPNTAPTVQDVQRAAATGDVLVQRVIKVPIKRLLDGDPQVNVVVRPGDTIHFPTPPEGLIYLTGQVARPGPYNMPASGKLTLAQAIVSAGGLGNLAIPERVDLIRRVGPTTQAIVRIDYRAIAEGTQPDIFLKPEDMVNVGTNFWATPLAVIRNGFRASYGFGFIVDRNFGNDIFGAPPSNRNGE